MSTQIRGGSTADLLTINSDKQAEVNLPRTTSQAGFATLTDKDSPSRYIEISEDFRLRVGVDSQLFFWDANSANQNINQYSFSSATFSGAQANGFLTLNSAASTAVGNYNAITFRTFPVFGSMPVYGDLTLKGAGIGVTNSNMEWGFGYISGTTAPTDGAFFRITAGVLRCVISDAGTETISSDITLAGLLSDNVLFESSVVVHKNTATFWINDVKVATVNSPSGVQGAARSQSLPFFFRNNSTGVTSPAAQMSIASNEVTLGDLNSQIPVNYMMAMQGRGSYQGQDTSSAFGSTSNLTNSGTYGSGTLTNTAVPSAGYTGNTLGGRFQFAALAAAATDLILFGYQVPQGTNAVLGQQLVITSIVIDAVNTGAAVATTPTTHFYFLGVGATAISLATADATITTVKAPRRVPLGFQTWAVGAVVGQQAERLVITFPTPIVCDPGQFVTIGMNVQAGTATASQVIVGSAMVNGYFM